DHRRELEACLQPRRAPQNLGHVINESEQSHQGCGPEDHSGCHFISLSCQVPNGDSSTDKGEYDPGTGRHLTLLLVALRPGIAKGLVHPAADNSAVEE